MDNLNFTAEEVKRYQRHFSLQEIGVEGQKRLKRARVLCVGAGGLGSPVLLYLTAAGVGALGIIDDDKVELSNLQRQILYSEQDVNASKVEAAKTFLNKLNPHTEILTHEEALNPENAFDIISKYDVVVDGSDNFPTRYLINDVCFYLQKPNIAAAVYQFEGQCSVFIANEGPCYRCLYPAPPPPGLIPNCAQAGVLGVVPGVMGMIQATEVLKWILDKGDLLVGRLLTFDALAMRFQEFPVTQNSNCLLCAHHLSFETLPRYTENVCITQENTMEISVEEFHEMRQRKIPFFLLDVREPYEFEICNLGGHLIPLRELSARLHELNPQQTIIVHCHKGGRSRQAVEWLQEAGFKQVFNLSGGIAAWAEIIDSSMPQY